MLLSLLTCLICVVFLHAYFHLYQCSFQRLIELFLMFISIYINHWFVSSLVNVFCFHIHFIVLVLVNVLVLCYSCVVTLISFCKCVLFISLVDVLTLCYSCACYFVSISMYYCSCRWLICLLCVIHVFVAPVCFHINTRFLCVCVPACVGVFLFMWNFKLLVLL